MGNKSSTNKAKHTANSTETTTQFSGNQNCAPNYYQSSAVTDAVTIIDKETFAKIVYFWFHTSFNSNSKHQISIDDIINCCYNFYSSLNGILLKYYYLRESQEEMHGLMDNDNEMISKDSYLWIIHSNKNVYFIKDCHHLENIIADDKYCHEMNEYIDDKYLVKHETLSSKKYKKLVSILNALQINIKYCDAEGGGYGWWSSTKWIISHCGKHIAENHGHHVKKYKELNEINCDELMRFMKDDMKIDVRAISDVIKYPILDTGYRLSYADREETFIDNDKNILVIEDSMEYS